MTAYITHPEEARAVRATRDRIGKLLSRYPHVSDGDRREILTFMKEGRHLDIGLLTANDNLRPRLDAFMTDHEHHFRIDAGTMFRVLAMLGAAVITCWLLWELLGPASL